jgi:uncharacterized protein DUF5666
METTTKPSKRWPAIVAGLVAAGLLVGAGVGFAAGHLSSHPKTVTAAAPSLSFDDAPRGGAGPGGGVAGEQHVQGAVTATTASTITVTSGSGTATYAVDATTQIVRNGRNATLADLKVGDPVVVHVYPSSSGELLVERILAGTTPAGPGFDGPPTAQPPTSTEGTSIN